MRKFILIFFLPLLLAGCSLAPSASTARYAGNEEPTPIPTVPAAAKPTYTVQRGNVTVQLSLTGRIAPLIEESLGFTQPGQIADVLVARQDIVEAGQPLLRLDTTALEQSLALAESELAIAEARLATRQNEVARESRRAELRRDMAQLDLEYAMEQGGDAPTPAQQYEIARLALQLELAQLDVDELDVTVDPGLQADVDQATLRVAELGQALAATELVAPFSGLVLTVNATPGLTVAADEPVITVADVSEYEINVNVPVRELEQMAENLPAIIQDAAAPGESFGGVIYRLPYPYGSGSPDDVDSISGRARIRFDDPAAAQAAFELSKRVQARTVVAERDGVLWLPPGAIREFGGRRFVVVEEGGVQQRVDVTLGIQGDGRVEILDGLTEGQVVIGQ